MDLGIFKKQQEQEYFWSLVIGKNWVEAGIWRLSDNKTEVVATGPAGSWQEDNEETLISAADSSLSAAAGTLEEDAVEPTKVVFGLPPAWIENGNIKNERLAALKKLCKELELKPAGFVVIPEAITHFLKAKEGAPLNGILVGLSEDSIDVSLVQSGKILGTTEVGRSMSLGQDLAEGLARLPRLAQYPSRILLYDHRVGNLDEARQSLINIDWKEFNVSFLHTPKVEILPEDVGVSSVSLAGGAEVGHAEMVIVPEKEGEPERTRMENNSAKLSSTEYSIEEVAEEEPEKELEEVPIEELGFIRGDISKHEKVSVPVSESISQEKVGPKEDEPLPEPKKKGVSLPNFSFPKKDWAFSPPSIPFKPFGSRFAGLSAITFFLALILLGVAYWYLPKAQVTVYVAPKTLEKTIELQTEGGGMVLPTREVKTPVSGEKTTQTTGTKTVGDRARGRVVLYSTGGSTTLKAGTSLLGPNGLKFTLDEDTPVASGSSSANPSKTQTVATAADIGAQYNLASGVEFAVGNFSKSGLSAKNEEAFGGGTSREVSAAAKEDIESLEKELSEELFRKGADSLKSSLGDQEMLIEEGMTLVASKKNFSHKAGEETSTLRLAFEGEMRALVVSTNAVNELVRTEVQKDVPQGFALRDDQIEINIRKRETEGSKKEETASRFNAEIKANLLPKIDPEEVVKNIRGKYPLLAKEYLSSIPGFTRAEISFSFKFPGKLGTLPRVGKNISLEVTAER